MASAGAGAASAVRMLALGVLVGQCCAAPMGLFIATSDYGDGVSTEYGRTATAALQLICTHLNATTSPLRVRSLALDHLTDSSGTYAAVPLAKLATFFDCFDTVFVGTADNHLAPDIYCTGLLNTSFTAEYLRRSVAAAQRFGAEHADQPNWQWYLNYEAAGNYFGTGCTHFSPVQHPRPPSGTPPSAPPLVSAEAFTAAYVKIFGTLIPRLLRIRDAAVMWSPTFNERAVDVVDRRALVGNITHLFAQLPGLSEVANQDAVGKYSLYIRGAKRTMYNLSCADTVYYQAVLTEAAEAAAAAVTIAGRGERARVEITVNMELFSRRDTVPQSTIVGDPMEHAERRCCYAAHNLTIGPSWEITDWYTSNFREWDPAGPPSLRQVKVNE